MMSRRRQDFTRRAERHDNMTRRETLTYPPILRTSRALLPINHHGNARARRPNHVKPRTGDLKTEPNAANAEDTWNFPSNSANVNQTFSENSWQWRMKRRLIAPG